MPVKKPVAKPAAVDAAVPATNKKAAQPLQVVRGMRDLLPADQVYWKQTNAIAEKLANAYGYERIDTPIVEDTALFVRGVGRATDIVEKEL